MTRHNLAARVTNRYVAVPVTIIAVCAIALLSSQLTRSAEAKTAATVPTSRPYELARTTPTTELGARMAALVKGAVGPSADGDQQFAAFSGSDLVSKSLTAHDTFSLDQVVRSSKTSELWRLFLRPSSAEDANPAATCEAKLKIPYFQSCQAIQENGRVFIVSISAIPASQLTYAVDGPATDAVRYTRSVSTVGPTGLVAAFHDVVDGPSNAVVNDLFATSDSVAQALVQQASQSGNDSVLP